MQSSGECGLIQAGRRLGADEPPPRRSTAAKHSHQAGDRRNQGGQGEKRTGGDAEKMLKGPHDLLTLHARERDHASVAVQASLVWGTASSRRRGRRQAGEIADGSRKAGKPGEHS